VTVIEELIVSASGCPRLWKLVCSSSIVTYLS